MRLGCSGTQQQETEFDLVNPVETSGAEIGTVTYEDIARECGVGKSTVHRALNEAWQGGKKTRAAILACAKRLGYHPFSHQAARRMAYRRHGKSMLNHMVALFLPVNFQRYPYYREILQGVLDAMVEQGYDLIVSYDRESGPSPMPRSMVSGEVDGAILNSDVSLDDMRRLPGFASRPVVGLLQPSPNCSSVAADDWSAASMALGHLLDLGHRHVLHFYEERSDYYSEQRLSGYRNACLQRGLNPSDVLILCPPIKPWTTDPFTAAWVTEAIPRTLNAFPQVTAILARQDEDAVVIHDVLTRNGLRVPKDISLVGCDDVRPIAGAQCLNILTTVNLSLHDVGQEAGRMLINLIERRSHCESRVTVPASLVVRGSTAPPRGGKTP